MAGNAHSGCSSTSPGLGTSPCTSRRARNGGSSPRPPTRRRRAGPPSRRPAAMETVCRPLCGCERGNVPGGFPYPQKQKFPPPRSLIPAVDSPKPDSLRMKSPTDQICAGSETPKLKIKKKEMSRFGQMQVLWISGNVPSAPQGGNCPSFLPV